MNAKNYIQRHWRARSDPQGFERPIVSMLNAIKDYAELYQAEYHSSVGQDYVLGDEGIKPMLQALLTLLNGEIGRLDGGMMDREIREVAEILKIDLGR